MTKAWHATWGWPLVAALADQVQVDVGITRQQAAFLPVHALFLYAVLAKQALAAG